MAARCEMCGAKIREGDLACPECGAPLPASVEPPAAGPISTPAMVPTPPSEPGPQDWPSNAPVDDFEPPRRRVGLWLGIGAVGLAVAGTGAFLAMSGTQDPPAAAVNAQRPTIPGSPDSPDSPEAPAVENDSPAAAAAGKCPELASLVGHWSFITEVTGARVVQSSGLNGFYTLDVALDGCAATASLVKTGYTARKFTTKRLQRASSPLVLGEGAWGSMATGTFELTSEVGAHGTIEISFLANDGSLSGVYRQRGARWADTGLSGFLHGDREEAYPHDPVLSSQPCAVRCNVVCDAAQRETVAQEAFSTCTEACGAAPQEPARCGDATPTPPEQQLALAGPAPLKRLCKKIGGCAKKLGRGHPKPPRIAADRLAQPWTEVKMVRGKKEGGPRLALHGGGGWYLSDPLLDVPRQTRLGLLRLYARQLGEGEDRRFVLGLARQTGEGAPESFFACRLDDAPSCVRVGKARNDYVSALPEGTLSVGSSAAVHTW